jgi:hypothetical protein
VQVKSCGAFYVYNLQLPSPAPTTCVRFCGAAAATPAPVTASPRPFPAQCYAAYNTFSLASRAVGFNDGNNGVELCDGRTSAPGTKNDWAGNGWYRFQGAWATFPPIWR